MTGAPAHSRLGVAVRMALRLAVIVAVALAAHKMMVWAELQSDLKPGPEGDAVVFAVFGLVLLAYAVAIAVPFVPGIEIGLTILMMQGPQAAPWVYLATVLGLMLGYLCGRFLPLGWLRRFFLDLGLVSAAGLLTRIEPLPPLERIGLLRERLPGRAGQVLIGWRYLLLAAALNLPGNWLIGGGGGIMLVSGLSGLFRPAPVLATIALAVAPVPLIFWWFGIELL